MRPSGRETSKASRGSSIPQKIIDVVVPVGVSNEICEATYASGLEEAFSVPLLEGYGETRVPGIQQADFPPMPPAGNLWILLSDGVSSTPQEVQSFLPPTPKRLDGERDETSSRQGPSWIPPMVVFGGSCSGCTTRWRSRAPSRISRPQEP